MFPQPDRSMETNSPQMDADALFKTLFANVSPAEKQRMTLLETLKKYRPQILAKRKEGYSVRQIVACLRLPPLNLTVSTASVHAVIGGEAAKRRAKLKKMEAERTAKLGMSGPVGG